LALEIEAWLVERAVGLVVADAIEGYNPTHDVCRLLVDCALDRALRWRGLAIRNLELRLFTDPAAPAPANGARAEVLELDDAALERKWQAARANTALEPEVEMAVGAFGKEAFRTECVVPARPTPDWENASPIYEAYGEMRSAQGAYTRVIRYREHLLPLARALDRLVCVRP